MGLFGPPDVAKLKAKRDIPGLTKLFWHKDLDVAVQAASALADIGSQESLDALVACFGSVHFRSRRV